MEPTLISLPWIELVKLSVAAGVVTALVNQGLGWLRDHRRETKTRKREKEYLAIRLAVALERFAVDCTSVISDNKFYQTIGSAAGEPHLALPHLAEYPTDADWKSLASRLVARVLSFRTEVQLSNHIIESHYLGYPEGAVDACNEEAGKCGRIAQLLAADLRSDCDVEAFAPSSAPQDWSHPLEEYHRRALWLIRRRTGGSEG